MANMALENVVAVQRDDSAYISDFTITLKEIRFASTKTSLFKPNTFQGLSNPNQAGGASDISSGISSIFGLNNNIIGNALPIQSGNVNGISVPIASYDQLKAMVNAPTH